MSLTHRSLRSPTVRTALRTPSLSLSRFYATGTSDWSGRQPSEHATNRGDELDVQSGASQSGKRERASGDANQSQATTQKDSGKGTTQNEQAKKDLPEAPDVVIGMNDERGQMGHKG